MGDAVVVEFVNRSRETPQVIGFVEHPKSCKWEPWGGEGLCDLHQWSIEMQEPFIITACPDLPYGQTYIESGEEKFRGWSWHTPHVAGARRHPRCDWKIQGTVADIHLIADVPAGEVSLDTRRYLRFKFYINCPEEGSRYDSVIIRINHINLFLVYGTGPFADNNAAYNYYIGNDNGVETVIDLKSGRFAYLEGDLSLCIVTVSAANGDTVTADLEYIDFTEH